MTTFAYNRNIPDGPNNPSNDWSKMQVNTNNTDDLINVDHYSFGVANGGFHRQVRFVNETIPAVGASQVGLYSKSSGQSQVFGTSDAGAKEYQLTRFVDASFANFGQFNVIAGQPVNYTMNGGWSFLPGGILYQYGRVTYSTTIPTNSNQGPFVFPVAFTTSNITLIVSPFWSSVPTNEGQNLATVNGTVTSTGFSVAASSTNGSPSSFKGFYFTAIGI